LVDLLIAMGGPMSVNDETELPWLRAEKRLIRDAIDARVPVLGVCLGAQMIASALGARVHRNPVKEIGWFPIQAVPGPPEAFRFPEECTVFHWHGETFERPHGAVHLARSRACENQGFQLGTHVIGLQFHLETTYDDATALLENCRSELVPGPYVQSEQDIRNVPRSRYRAVNDLMDQVLGYLVRRTS
jgi:GMP synthase-like glutamine amidotransferase